MLPSKFKPHDKVKPKLGNGLAPWPPAEFRGKVGVVMKVDERHMVAHTRAIDEKTQVAGPEDFTNLYLVEFPGGRQEWIYEDWLEPA